MIFYCGTTNIIQRSLATQPMSRVPLIKKHPLRLDEKARLFTSQLALAQKTRHHYFSTKNNSLSKRHDNTDGSVLRLDRLRLPTKHHLNFITRAINDDTADNARPGKGLFLNHTFDLEEYNKDRFNDEVMKLAKQGAIKDIIAKGAKLTPELIYQVIGQLLEGCPPMPPNASNIEVPCFEIRDNIRFDYPYYNFINSKMPLIYELLKNTTDGSILLPYNVRVNYHMNDIKRMMSYETAIVDLDPKTILYYLSLFIHNYELEEFKKQFHNLIINTKKTLPGSVLDCLVPQLVGHDIVFENLFFVFQLWMNSPKCDPPLARLISLILLEFHRFGTAQEIKEFKRLIKKYNDEYLVKTIDYQFEIINRDYLKFKKPITQEDLDNIASMAPVNGDIEFYYRWLFFMIRYSNMENINFILKLYKESECNTGLLPSRFFKLLLDYYEKHDKFIPLLQLLEASKDSVSFDPAYLSTIAKTFIYSYSRFAPQFITLLNEWIGKQCFELTKLSSQFYPYHLSTPINRRKYKEPEWEEIKFDPDKDISDYRYQVDFRIQQGFHSLLARGVRPDFKMVLDTFRFGDLDDRLAIKYLLIQTRLYNHKNQKTMELRSLKHPTLEKDDLLRYFETNKDELNDSHKFYFSRMLIEFDLLEEAKFLLDTIDDTYLNDKNKMFKIILELRMYMMANDFENMKDALTRFKLHDDQLYISPYLLNQTLSVENALYHKLRKNQETMDQEMLIAGKDCLMQMRFFIGDVKLLLDKDEQEMSQLIDKTIDILNQWKENGK